MTQHITQEVATQIAAQFAEDEDYETNICNAAIQWDRDQLAKELPVLPEHITDVLVITGPSTHKHMQAGQYYYTTSQAQAYGQQCAAHARELTLSEAKLVAKTTCHHESTEFANGFNMAALNIESAIEALKGK